MKNKIAKLERYPWGAIKITYSNGEVCYGFDPIRPAQGVIIVDAEKTNSVLPTKLINREDPKYEDD